MWSAAVLAEALPGRSGLARALPVLSRKHSSRWYPKPCLQVSVASSFSEWRFTKVASMSRTSPGSARPPARERDAVPCFAGLQPCGLPQAARALAQSVERGRDEPASSRQAVGVEAMVPKARPKMNHAG
jgi:hypothetical protein